MKIAPALATTVADACLPAAQDANLLSTWGSVGVPGCRSGGATQSTTPSTTGTW